MKVNTAYQNNLSSLPERGRATDTSLFSHFVGDLHGYYDKHRFDSLADIPEDMTGFEYPKFEDLCFYLPEYLEETPKFVTVDAQSFVETLGSNCYEIHPVRWHRIKTYVRDGKIEYPRIYEGGQISDGRHRTLVLIKLYGIKTIEVLETEW